MKILHMVDGNSTGFSLRGFLPRAEMLVWFDALYEGAVPGGLSLRALSRIRERHWGAKGELVARERRLAAAGKFDEVVLWFGPTMVCQLSLIQLLDWFAAHPHPKLTLVDWDYAGYYPPHELGPLYEQRRPVTRKMIATGRRAWKAFTSPRRGTLERYLEQDSSVLPELRPILARVVQEYPDSSGLSRIERKVLQQFEDPLKAAAGVARAMPGETFGDIYYFTAIERFLRSNNQLLCFAEPPPENPRAAILALTDFGRKVLAGRADAIAFNGIDRWVGGVRFEKRVLQLPL